jgi:hypothetical protein
MNKCVIRQASSSLSTVAKLLARLNVHTPLQAPSAPLRMRARAPAVQAGNGQVVSCSRRDASLQPVF